MRTKTPGSGMKKGTYLNGVRSPHDLLLRSRVDPATDCWRWGLSKSRQGAGPNVTAYPKVWLIHPVDGRRTAMSGRRAALLLERGKDLPKGHVAYARKCCAWDDCVNPAHSRSGSRQEHGEWVRRTGRVKGLPALRHAMLKRAKTLRRLTDEQVIKIRLRRDVSCKEFADRFRVSEFTVWSARKGYRYADVGRVTSVFNLALAA